MDTQGQKGWETLLFLTRSLQESALKGSQTPPSQRSAGDDALRLFLCLLPRYFSLVSWLLCALATISSPPFFNPGMHLNIPATLNTITNFYTFQWLETLLRQYTGSQSPGVFSSPEIGWALSNRLLQLIVPCWETALKTCPGECDEKSLSPHAVLL